jgi:hypothetical protein
MADWNWLAEKRIRKAIEEGYFSNLPGTGKPLLLDDDSLTPAHLRLAYKILRDNGLAPEWMLMGQELDRQQAHFLANVRRGVRAYLGALGDAGRIADPERAAERCRRIDAAWQTACATFREVAVGLNRQITTYNLKVPSGIPHKPYLDFQREINQMLEPGMTT